MSTVLKFYNLPCQLFTNLKTNTNFLGDEVYLEFNEDTEDIMRIDYVTDDELGHNLKDGEFKFTSNNTLNEILLNHEPDEVEVIDDYDEPELWDILRES